MRLIYVNSSKVTKLEQKMNNSESFLLLLKNLLKCTYEVLLPSQRFALSRVSVFKIPFFLSEFIPNASFLRDFTNDQNFFSFSLFLGLPGSRLSVSKENILEICFQYASLMTF